MPTTSDCAVEAMKPLAGLSARQRVSILAYLLKVSLMSAMDIEDEAAQNDFDERMQGFIDDYQAAWGGESVI